MLINPGQGERLRQLRALTAFRSQKSAAKAYGVGEQLYKKLEQETRNLTLETASQIADYHGVSKGWLAFGEGHPAGPAVLSVEGVIGAGQELTLFDDGDRSDTVEAFFRADAIACEVKGESMLPLARDGDYVFFERPHRDILKLVTRECLVVLEDDRRFLKILHRGSRPDVFTLSSYNAEPIADVAVHKAGLFLGVKRRNAALMRR